MELKKHRRRIVLIKFLISLLSLLAIFASLAYISRTPSLNISDIEIIGNKVADAEMIKADALKEIAGNYFFLFPKTNIFFYPKNSIKKELESQFKRLKDVNLSVKAGVLQISLTEREPKYTWCGVTALDPTLSEKCYFMDEDGFIFDEAPYYSGEVYFKFYGSADTGTYFSKENFKQLIYFKDTLTAIGLKPVSLYVGDDGDVKIFLSALNRTTTGPYITFKIDADFQKLAENLETALSTEPLLSSFKNKYDSLLYIDLRFGNKVYYKFR